MRYYCSEKTIWQRRVVPRVIINQKYCTDQGPDNTLRAGRENLKTKKREKKKYYEKLIVISIPAPKTGLVATEKEISY